MSYHVKTGNFEGPFDLLLHLVARRKLDIGAVSIVDVTDQYLEYLDNIKDVDLDVASDFLLVASQLLAIKAASLIPEEEVQYGDELDDLDPDEAREILIARLINYKKFKAAALALGNRMAAEARMHPRSAGLEPQFVGLMPDYLEDVTLRGLAVICADLDSRRETFLLEAEHIAAMPVPVELHVESIRREMSQRKRSTFTELIGDDDQPANVVVTLLALLELYKRCEVSMVQDAQFSDIEVAYLEGEEREKILATSAMRIEEEAAKNAEEAAKNADEAANSAEDAASSGEDAAGRTGDADDKPEPSGTTKEVEAEEEASETEGTDA